MWPVRDTPVTAVRGANRALPCTPSPFLAIELARAASHFAAPAGVVRASAGIRHLADIRLVHYGHVWLDPENIIIDSNHTNLITILIVELCSMSSFPQRCVCSKRLLRDCHASGFTRAALIGTPLVGLSLDRFPNLEQPRARARHRTADQQNVLVGQDIYHFKVLDRAPLAAHAPGHTLPFPHAARAVAATN